MQRLANHGCAVLVGPPGTGKSHTIVNVICHYLATGRRVLVTSKGEPALEVLRLKLPEGVRELAVSLGSTDASSYRRLEAAVENLGSHVANADPRRLAAATDSLRRRLRSISAELGAIEAAELKWARPHFPANDETAAADACRAGVVAAAEAAEAAAVRRGRSSPCPVTTSTARRLWACRAPSSSSSSAGASAAAAALVAPSGFLSSAPLHPEHLAALGIASQETATFSHIAETIVALTGPDGAPMAVGVPRRTTDSRLFPLGRADRPAEAAADGRPRRRRPRPPPPVRRRPPLGGVLSGRPIRTEKMSAPAILRIAAALQERARLEQRVLEQELPRLAPDAVDDARTLHGLLATLGGHLLHLEESVRVNAASVAAFAKSAAGGHGGGGGSAPSSSSAASGGKKAAKKSHGASPGGAAAAAAAAPAAAAAARCSRTRAGCLACCTTPTRRRRSGRSARPSTAAQRLAGLSAQVASSAPVELPKLLKQYIDDDIQRAMQGGGSGGEADGVVVEDLRPGASEALDEVRWHAHPDKRGTLDSMLRPWKKNIGGKMLNITLNDISVDKRSPPATPRDWQLIEQVLNLRVAAAAFRAAWAALKTYVPPPPLPDKEDFARAIAAIPGVVRRDTADGSPWRRCAAGAAAVAVAAVGRAAAAAKGGGKGAKGKASARSLPGVPVAPASPPTPRRRLWPFDALRGARRPNARVWRVGADDAPRGVPLVPRWRGRPRGLAASSLDAGTASANGGRILDLIVQDPMGSSAACWHLKERIGLSLRIFNDEALDAVKQKQGMLDELEAIEPSAPPPHGSAAAGSSSSSTGSSSTSGGSSSGGGGGRRLSPLDGCVGRCHGWACSMAARKGTRRTA